MSASQVIWHGNVIIEIRGIFDVCMCAGWEREKVSWEETERFRCPLKGLNSVRVHNLEHGFVSLSCRRLIEVVFNLFLPLLLIRQNHAHIESKCNEKNKIEALIASCAEQWARFVSNYDTNIDFNLNFDFSNRFDKWCQINLTTVSTMCFTKASLGGTTNFRPWKFETFFKIFIIILLSRLLHSENFPLNEMLIFSIRAYEKIYIS